MDVREQKSASYDDFRDRPTAISRGAGTHRLLFALTFVSVMALGACTDSSGQSAQTPLKNSGPYLCGVIPEGVVAPLFGVDDFQVDEAIEGRPLEVTETTSCDLYIRSGLVDSMYISVFAGKDRGAEKLFQREEAKHSHVMRLPAELGDGGIRHTSDEIGREYIAHALFRCGNRSRWVRIQVTGPTEGRDPIADGTALMRMARARYAEVVECEITPPHTASPSPTDTPASG